MIVTCEQCQARFKMADEKLKAGGTKVRCSKCQTIFTVFPPASEPAGQDDTLAAAAPAETPAPQPPAPEPQSQPEPEPEPEPEPVPSPAESAPAVTPDGQEPGELDFDFGPGGEEPTAGYAEETFSFATSAAAEDAEDTAPPPVADATMTITDDAEDYGGFDLDSDFSTASAASHPEAQEAGMVEFDFGTGEESIIAAESPPAAAPPGEFDFSEQPAENSAAGDFAFAEGPAAEGLGEFDFSAEEDREDKTEDRFELPADEPGKAPTEPAGFGEVSFAEETEADEGGFSFGEESPGTPSPFGEEESGWGEPSATELGSFDFEEPTFETRAEPAAKPKEASSVFGEIDFSDEDQGGEPLPSFDDEPNFAKPPAPSETFAPPPPVPPPPPAAPVPRQPVSRPRSDEPIPALAPRRSPVSKMVVGLIVLLVVLCGAGAYLYVSGTGQRLLGQMVMKVKGEAPAGPVEQLISLKDIASSYVSNRDAGQLLVIQGSAVNNFPATRSAIAVKGMLLDGAGKVLQQQQVFCGNFLPEEKLRTLKFTEIEEAMSNQFGDSLSNLNVKTGAALKFTIVFRNVPGEMANINVEVVDSKPGG